MPQSIQVVYCYVQGRPQDLGGGRAKNSFFQIWEFACREATCCALLGGFGGMLPREIFLKRCNLVRFRVYFDQILSLLFSKNAIFYIKNKYFRYTLVMGYAETSPIVNNYQHLSREEIFENLLRLMRFGIYFETKMAIS